jgi:hypothetical protein
MSCWRARDPVSRLVAAPLGADCAAVSADAREQPGWLPTLAR